MKKAIILDLDNTIYPVSSIAETLFNPLFELIDEYRDIMDEADIESALYQITRRPYQFVADECNFPEELKIKGVELLKNIEYHLPMHPYDGYEHLKTVNLKKFLVTTGFSKLQWSKIKMLDIKADFDEIHIVDPEVSTRSKKDVFEDIMKRHYYTSVDLLVIGDDPESEIKAAKLLGIDTFLYDPEDKHPNVVVTYRNKHLKNSLEHLR